MQPNCLQAPFNFGKFYPLIVVIGFHVFLFSFVFYPITANCQANSKNTTQTDDSVRAAKAKTRANRILSAPLSPQVAGKLTESKENKVAANTLEVGLQHSVSTEENESTKAENNKSKKKEKLKLDNKTKVGKDTTFKQKGGATQ